MSFTAYGTRFGIRVNDPDLLEQLSAHLPLGCEPSFSAEVDFLYSLRTGGPGKRRGTRHYNLLYAGSGQLVRTMELDVVLNSLEAHLQMMTAYLAEERLFVHAGVVGWQGQAIVIPGRGYSGKTTLVAALVKTGAIYYSDEFAIFDRQGYVHPYPRPFSFRDSSGQRTGLYPVEALGGQVGEQPLPVGLVVVTEYQAGARWRPRPLTPGQAVLALMENTIAARKNPERSLPILKQVVSGPTLVKSKRGEAEAVVAPLLKLVNQRSVVSEAVSSDQ